MQEPLMRISRRRILGGIFWDCGLLRPKATAVGDCRFGIRRGREGGVCKLRVRMELLFLMRSDCGVCVRGGGVSDVGGGNKGVMPFFFFQLHLSFCTGREKCGGLIVPAQSQIANCRQRLQVFQDRQGLKNKYEKHYSLLIFGSFGVRDNCFWARRGESKGRRNLKKDEARYFRKIVITI